MKRSLMQTVAAGALAVASVPAAFATAVVPGGGIVSSYSGTTPVGDNGGLVFSLFSTNADHTFSLTNFLGLSLNDVVPTEMATGGMKLTWHLDGLSNIPSSVLPGELAWGVSASDNGATTNATVGDIRLVTTVNTALGSVTPSNLGIANPTNSWNTTVTPFNNVSNTSPTDFTTTALNPNDLLDKFNVNDGIPGFSWVGGLSDPLAMYLYTESGGRGHDGDPATADLYAGMWALDLAKAELTYSVGGVSPVPLPAAVWLLLSGLTGLGLVGRRKSAPPLVARA